MIDVELPCAGTFSLDTSETRELVDLLWGVSGVSGAVVAIGRLRHSLERSLRDPVRLAGEEERAVRLGLEAAERLPSGLARMRSALRDASS